MDRKHISPSQISMHGQCEQKWHFRYVDGIKLPPGIALLKGASPHTAAEVNNRQKIDTRLDLSLSVLQDVAADALDKKIATDGVELTKEEESRGRYNVIGELKDKIVHKIVPTYASVIAPSIQPVMVEEAVTIELPGQDYDLLGIIDVADEQGFVRDLKITGRSKSQGEADTSLALTAYDAMYTQKTGKPPVGVSLDVIVDLKSGPKTQRLDSRRDNTDTSILASRMTNMVAQIKSGAPPKPAAIGDPLCSPRFCGYWNMCPYVNNTRKVVAESYE